MTKGHCKHGEFELTEGCPQCIAERQAQEASRAAEANYHIRDDNPDLATPLIVKVRYIKRETGEVTGREYSYFTEEPLGLDFHVKAPTEHGHVEAVVTALDVPEAEVAAFRDRVRTIPAGSIIVRPAPELDFGPVETPPVAQVASLFNPDPPQEEAVPLITEAEAAIPDDNEAAAQMYEAHNQGTAVVKVAPDQDPRVMALYQEGLSLQKFAQDRVIATAEDLKPATNDLAIIAKTKKAVEEKRTEYVGPIREHLGKVNDAFKRFLAPFEEADRLTRGKVQKFDLDQRTKAAEAKRIEDEKARLAREEAAFNGTGEITVPLGTVEEVAPPPEHVRTDLGTLGGRDNWKARVVDFAALPDEYKIPNESLLNSHARTTKGERPIPGVEFYNDRITTIRTK